MQAGHALPRSELESRARSIRLAVFDVDGVMTDGRLIYGSEGEELKGFHVHDGWGLKALGQAGIITAIITARHSPMVSRRAEELAIEHVVQGSGDKLRALQTLLQALNLDSRQACYTGDDIPDLLAMQQCGLAMAVANARPEIIAAAHWVSQQPGGQGAVREVCDLLLRVRAH